MSGKSLDYADVRRVLNDSTEGAEMMSSCRLFHYIYTVSEIKALKRGILFLILQNLIAFMREGLLFATFEVVFLGVEDAYGLKL